MSDFQDPELQDRLRRLGGSRSDDDLAYIQLQQRVRVAKRRRAVTAVGGLGAACLIGIASLLVANRGEEQITPADGGVDATEVKTVDPSDVSSTDVEETTTSQPTATTSPAATTAETTAPTTVAPETTVPPPTATTGAADASPSIPANTPSTSPGGASPNDPPSNSAPSSSTPSTGPSSVSGEPTTYTSMGGTVTVRVDNGRLTLVDRHANAGYHAEVEDDEGDVIRVRFESDDRTTRIEVRYADGTLTPAIDNDIGHGEGSTSGEDPGIGEGEGSGDGDGEGGGDVGSAGSDSGGGSDNGGGGGGWGGGD